VNKHLDISTNILSRMRLHWNQTPTNSYRFGLCSTSSVWKMSHSVGLS